MAELIYGLCSALSLFIAVMLWRQQRRGPTRMIYWTALCFTGLALSNLLLFGLVYEDE